jgi:hypothetical protein
MGYIQNISKWIETRLHGEKGDATAAKEPGKEAVDPTATQSGPVVREGGQKPAEPSKAREAVGSPSTGARHYRELDDNGPAQPERPWYSPSTGGDRVEIPTNRGPFQDA